MESWCQEFLITLETPAKKNSRINLRNGISIPSERYRKWHREAMEQLDGQKSILNISEPVKIQLTFTHGDYRRRDSDNGTSSIMDLLVDAGILVDDNWKIVRELEVINTYNKDKPSCLIVIEPAELTI